MSNPYSPEEIRKIAEVIDKVNRLTGRNYSPRVSRNRAVVGELIRSGFSPDDLIKRATLVFNRYKENKQIDTTLVGIFTDPASFTPTDQIIRPHLSRKFKEYKQRRPYAKLEKPKD